MVGDDVQIQVVAFMILGFVSTCIFKILDNKVPKTCQNLI